MAAGYNDRADISIGLAEAYLRFKKAGVQAELHMYAQVGHGFGLRPERPWQSHAGVADAPRVVPAPTRTHQEE